MGNELFEGEMKKGGEVLKEGRTGGLKVCTFARCCIRDGEEETSEGKKRRGVQSSVFPMEKRIYDHEERG